MKLRAALALGFVLSLSSLALADVGPPPGDMAKPAAVADLGTATPPKDEGCNMAGGTAGGAAVIALLGLFAARRRR